MIYVDYREKRLMDAMEKLGIKFKCASLSIGDVLVNKDIVIERKDSIDFSKSFIDGRLFKQIEQMKKTFKTSILIIEGDIWTDYLLSNKIKSTILIKIIENNVNILPSHTVKETAYMIKRIIEKNFNKTINIPNKKTYKINPLYAIPGINKKRAQIIEKNFKDMYDLANADLKKISSIKGLGKKTYEKIFNFFHKPFNQKNH